MKLNKKIFPEINILSVLIAIGWIAWVGFILFASGNIFLGIAVITGMTFSYLNIYHDCRHHYILKEHEYQNICYHLIDKDISRLEKKHQDPIEKRRKANYEKLAKQIRTEKSRENNLNCEDQ